MLNSEQITLQFPPSMSRPTIPIHKVISVISHHTRWRILDEFLKEDTTLPASELARRIGITATAMSKHIKMLANAGVLVASYGCHYKLPAYWRVPGERALDFGAAVIRLDHLHTPK